VAAVAARHPDPLIKSQGSVTPRAASTCAFSSTDCTTALSGGSRYSPLRDPGPELVGGIHGIRLRQACSSGHRAYPDACFTLGSPASPALDARDEHVVNSGRENNPGVGVCVHAVGQPGCVIGCVLSCLGAGSLDGLAECVPGRYLLVEGVSEDPGGLIGH